MPQSHHDPAWLDHMYNNRALVPDHADYFERWARESATVRSAQPCAINVAYGPELGETLDVFPTVSPLEEGAPVLVFIHGGYWRSLDKSDHSFIAPAFTRAGCCVVVVNYALCPGPAEAPVTVAHIGRQMEAALVWVGRHVADHGGDPQRITVAGHSAGGQLAAWLLARVPSLTAAGLPCAGVRNALSISGVHDLEPLMHTPFLQEALRLTPEQVMQCSPARLATPSAGQLICAVGGDESVEFQRQNQLMQKAWGSHRVPDSMTLPGLNHFSVLEALVRPGHPLHRIALSLLGS